MRRNLIMSRIAMLALLAGIVAGTAYGQAEPAGVPPGARDPNDAYWPQADAAYDREPDYFFDRDGAPDVDLGFFYNELSPYENDHGWTWVSDEPFGWATCHYGRWAWDSQLSWFETQSTAVRPLVAPVRRMSDPGPMSVAPRTKPVPRDD